jgi:hypothetical protein
LHDLCHSFASFLVHRGVSLYVVQGLLLGHLHARLCDWRRHQDQYADDGAGDYLQAQVRALRYVFHTPNSNWDKVAGRNEGFGELNDAIYGGTAIDGAATGLGLTSAWSVNAAYEHFWNLRWRSSLYGGYAAVSYGSRANAMLFEVEGAVLVAGRRQ